MRLEQWRSLSSLLICCPDSATLTEIQPLLKPLQQALPSTKILHLVIELQSLNFSAFQSLLETLFPPPHLPTSPPFPAALIFTQPNQSPYAIAYLCYLAGIPIRIGQSQEFGGGVLSECIKPPIEPASTIDHYLHLLTASGLNISTNSNLVTQNCSPQ